jgi:hypothetical protein
MLVSLSDDSALFVMAGQESSERNVPSYMVSKKVVSAIASALARNAKPRVRIQVLPTPAVMVDDKANVVIHAWPSWKATIVPAPPGKFHLQVTA